DFGRHPALLSLQPSWRKILLRGKNSGPPSTADEPIGSRHLGDEEQKALVLAGIQFAAICEWTTRMMLPYYDKLSGNSPNWISS
ncbi:MAG: hypothetical protein EBT02_16055, partial [Planctomycetia bacterium]|nr:hypothetical protein [Planctomycetia bacterium]